MRHAAWMTVAVVLLAGSVAWAGGPGGGTRIEGTITAIDAEAQQLVVADTTVQVTEQTLIKKNGRTIAFADLAVGLTVAACGTLEDEVLVANQITVKQCRVAAAGPAALAVVDAPSKALPPLSGAEQDGLIFMREEEKLARDVYITLYATWKKPVFTNIAASEQTHMDAILTLLVRYGVPDPVAGMGVGEFATEYFQTLYVDLVALGNQSLSDAYSVGVTIEETDIDDLVALLVDVTHRDIQRVYQNLKLGSENHLQAFTKLLAGYSATCIAQ